MLFTEKVAGAQYDGAGIRNESTGMRLVARRTDDVARWQITVGKRQVFEKEYQQRACITKIFQG